MSKSVLMLVTALAVPSYAIVVSDYQVAEATPSGFDWSYVYNYKSSSAVAVGGNWLLTAAHVADDGGAGSISIGGTTYLQQQIVFHSTADLALVRYDKTFPGHYALYAGNLTDDGGLLPVLKVGYGTMGKVHDFSWTDNGSGRGTRRWGTQEIDRQATRVYDVGSVPTVNSGFWMDFDLISTMHEAGTGVGDSGGGVFYEDDGDWKLAGINVERSLIGGGYTSTFAISTSDYADWVVETIPEPVTTSLMGLGTLGMFLCRSKQRRNMMVRTTLLPVRHEPLCDLFFVEDQQSSDRKVRDCLVEKW